MHNLLKLDFLSYIQCGCYHGFITRKNLLETARIVSGLMKCKLVEMIGSRGFVLMIHGCVKVIFIIDKKNN